MKTWRHVETLVKIEGPPKNGIYYDQFLMIYIHFDDQFTMIYTIFIVVILCDDDYLPKKENDVQR